MEKTMAELAAKLVRYCTQMMFVTLIAAGFFHGAHAQGSIAVVPLFHDRLHQSVEDEKVQLLSGRIVVFVYQNAAAVCADVHFVNTKSDSLTHEVALPSTKHASIRSSSVSNGLFDVEIWVDSERVEPSLDTSGGEWYTIHPSFGPHEEKKIRALFWVQTPMMHGDSPAGRDTAIIPEGKRALVVDLEHAEPWMDVIQSLDVIAIPREGMTLRNARVGVEPKNYFDQDGGYLWAFRDIEPSFSNDISILYSPPPTRISHWNTRAKLAAYMTTAAYGEILAYLRQLDGK